MQHIRKDLGECIAPITARVPPPPQGCPPLHTCSVPLPYETYVILAPTPVRPGVASPVETQDIQYTQYIRCTQQHIRQHPRERAPVRPRVVVPVDGRKLCGALRQLCGPHGARQRVDNQSPQLCARATAEVVDVNIVLVDLEVDLRGG